MPVHHLYIVPNGIQKGAYYPVTYGQSQDQGSQNVSSTFDIMLLM